MENIEEIILKSGLKKKDIARILKKSRQTLSTWINENKPEQIEDVKKAISTIHKNKFTATINEDNKDVISELKGRINELEKRLEDKEEIIRLLKRG